ncbi:MAG: ABC transporter ATP-binding protein [Candidatus Heimdallarchaeota archaeon]|nr:ABC transporter ATP-binding protein [Candidatus Heimdallarchaeota archaeon]
MSWFGVGRSEEESERKFTDKELTQQMMHYISPYKRAILITTIFIVINTALTLAPPYIIGRLFDMAIEADTSIGIIIALVITNMVLNFLTWFLGEYLTRVITIRAITKATRDLRMDMFHKIQNHDFRFFDTHITGKIMSRVMNDTDTLRDTLFFITQLIGNVLLVLASTGLLIYLNWQLALISLSLTPLLFLLMFIFRKIVRRTMLNWRKTVAVVNAAMGESISGIAVSKSFSREKQNLEDFKKVNHNNFVASFRRALTFATLWPIVTLLQVLVLVLLYLYGQNLVLFNSAVVLTPGLLYSFTIYLWRFFFPLTQVANFYSQYQAGLAAMERIFGLMSIESEVQQAEEPIILPEFRGKIEFKNMDFWYNEEEKVFEKFSLKIEPGETVAIVGETGAGKTTLASLLSRFYEIKGGEILIDGEDIRKLHIEWYRQQVALVLQDSFLFAGSIKDNIKFGRIWDDPTDEEVLQAAQAVQATEFIEDFPDGFETDVLERGKRLSTGQRQLVTFARALLADPKILILDEATASVDAYTEAMIQDALEMIMKGRTSIIIAHRLSTIKNADKIVMIEHGKIVEMGSHDQLLKKKGQYAELYETYFKHQSLF